MSIRLKLTLLIFILFISAIGNAFFIFHLEKNSEEKLAWVTHTNKVIIDINEFLSHIKDAETGQRGYLLTGDSSYLEPYKSGLVESEEHFTHLRELTSDNPLQQKRLDSVRKLINLKFDELAQTIKLKQNNNSNEALAIVNEGIGKQYMDGIRVIFHEFLQTEKLLLKQRENIFKKHTNFITNTIIIEIVLFVLLAFVTLLFLNKNLFSPLKSLLSNTKKMELGENIDVVKVESNDEIGNLTSSFFKMYEEVRTRTELLTKTNAQFQEAQRLTHLGNWEWDMVTDELIWNDEIYRIFGLDPKSVIPRYDIFMSYVYPDDRKKLEKEIEKSISKNVKYDIRHRLLLKDNVIKYVHEQAKVYKDEDNKPIRMIGTIQDISSEARVKNELKESEEKFRIMSEKTSTAIFIFQYTFIYANEAMTKIFGYSKDELSLIHPSFIIPVDNLEKYDKNLEKRLKGEFFTENYDSLFITTKGGDERLVSLHITTIPYKGGFAGLGTLMDVTDIKKAEEEVQKLSQVVEQTDDIVKITDSDGTMTYVNDAFVAKTGYTRREVLGKKPSYLKSGKHPPDFYKDLWNTILAKNIFRSVLINRKKNGSLYHEEQTITPILNERGKITSFVSTGKDISERIKMQEALEKEVRHDGLTGLYNRRYYDELVTKELSRARRENHSFSFIMMDIDFFKLYNDTYGHQEGDKTLQAVAKLLKEKLSRAGDYCFRLGGEEFGFFIIGNTLEESLKYTQVICNDIEQLHIKHSKNKASDYVTASFGLVHTDASVVDEQSIYIAADKALYKAKESGRNRVCVYETPKIEIF